MAENPYLSGDADMLREILREAESYLAAQLQCGLAADARATGFSSVLAAASAIVAAAGFTALSASPLSPLGFPALFVAVGLLASVALASWSARPVEFAYCGNTPSSWLRDLGESVSLQDALAEVASHYDEQIFCNREVLRRNGVLMKTAMAVAWASILLGGIWAGLLVIPK